LITNLLAYLELSFEESYQADVVLYSIYTIIRSASVRKNALARLKSFSLKNKKIQKNPRNQIAAEFKMLAELTLFSQSQRNFFNFFKMMFTLTNYRIFMELIVAHKYKMADLFKMVEIWAKFSKNFKLFFSYS
jgi:hypothetical protein